MRIWKVLLGVKIGPISDTSNLRVQNVSKTCFRGYQKYVFCIFDPLGPFWGVKMDIPLNFGSFLASPKDHASNLVDIVWSWEGAKTSKWAILALFEHPYTKTVDFIVSKNVIFDVF